MGNAKNITREEYEKFRAAHEDAAESGAFNIEEPNTDTATCAMLGGGYQIGDTIIPQVKPSSMALLSVAGVSMVSEPDDADDADAIRDMVVALYIIAGGSDAAHMLMGVKRRTDALKRLEGLAKKSPDMFERYMNKLDEIGGSAFAELESAAYRYVDSIDGFTYTEAFSVLNQMFADFSTPMGLLPAGSDTNDKKK